MKPSDTITLFFLTASLILVLAAGAFQDRLFPISRDPPDTLPLHTHLAVLADGPNPSAPIHLLEYGDYQCPNTRAQHTVIKQLLSEFGSSINYIRKDFPLNIHPNSKEAAIAARCVKTLSPQSHPSYEHMMYEHQHALSINYLTEYASNLTIDVPAFEACLTRPDMQERINQDMESALLEGVRGTPTLFINGKPFEGFQPYTKLRLIIETLLEQHTRQQTQTIYQQQAQTIQQQQT